MIKTLVDRNRAAFVLQADVENQDQLNRIRNAIHAENVSREMDHEPALLKSVGRCVVENTKVYAQIDCVDQEAMETVLDFMTNELDISFKIENLSLQQPSTTQGESFAPQYNTMAAQLKQPTVTLGQQTGAAITHDPNYGILNMSPEDFRDLLETINKTYQNLHQHTPESRRTIFGN